MNPKKILLIDDEQDILELLSYNLEKEGYEVSTATNGNEGIEKAKQILPDLILLDVMMATADEGFIFARKFKEDADISRIPVILVTGINSIDIVKNPGTDAQKTIFPPPQDAITAAVGHAIGQADVLRVALGQGHEPVPVR